MPQNIKDDLLNVIAENEAHSDLLNTGSGRTHFFLGTKRRGLENRLFTRYGDNSARPCILTQLYRKRYPQKPAHPDEGEPLVWFESAGFDCMFIERERKADKFGYPKEWEIGWLIEVENRFNEFSFTLRTMLDYVCHHRLAIFFASSFDVGELTGCFRETWQLFVKQYPFAETFHLAAIILPDRYSNTEQYRSAAQLLTWNSVLAEFKDT
jgi:hypothetical protein